MILSEEQIKDRIKNPKAKNDISEAFFFEERLRLHCMPYDENPDWNFAYNSFLSWVRDLLTSEKFERFKELLSSPIPTTDLTDEIFKSFKKIFEASNSRKDYFFEGNNKEEQEAEFRDFLNRNCDVWETKAYNEFKNYICSFMVIDMPSEDQKKEGLTEPYLSFVHIKDVIDASIDDKSNVDWLIYKIGEQKPIYVYVDSEKYATLDSDTNIYKEVSHQLKLTPCRQFWTSNVNDNYFKKKSPISYVLGKLDLILFHEVSKEYTELFAKFPIMDEYEQKEDYDDYSNNLLEPTFNSSSSYGYNIIEDGTVTQRKVEKEDKKNKSIGSGTIYSKRIPEEGQPDIGASVAFISPPIENLEYINENLENRKDDVFVSCTGAFPDFKNDQAKNEKQISSQFESQKAVLFELKKNFELAEKWVSDVMGKIKYPKTYKGCVVNYGTNFFLLTPQDIQEDIKNFKEIGMPETMLMDKQMQFLETTHKTDSNAFTRAKLLMELDPFPTMSIKEVSELAALGQVDVDMFQYKLQLPALIKEYERKVSDIDANLLIEDGDELDELKAELLQMLKPKSKEDDGREA